MLTIKALIENCDSSETPLNLDLSFISASDKSDINIINSLKDIPGYTDELDFENSNSQIQNQIKTLNRLKHEPEHIYLNGNSEFEIYLNDTLKLSDQLLIEIKDEDEKNVESFKFSVAELINLTEEDRPLVLNLAKSKIKKREERQRKAAPIKNMGLLRTKVEKKMLKIHENIKVKAQLHTINDVKIPATLKVIVWYNPKKEIKRFIHKELSILLVTETLDNGRIEFEYPNSTKLETVYISLSADEVIAQKIELTESKQIPENFDLVFSSFKLNKLRTILNEQESLVKYEELFYYKALRSSIINKSEQRNNSNLIKPISCFGEAEFEQSKTVKNGLILVIKQSWLATKELAYDSKSTHELAHKCFADKLNNYYIGCASFTLNQENNDGEHLQKIFHEHLNRFHYNLEEKIKNNIKHDANAERIHIEQELFDIREALFIPFELQNFDIQEVLTFKDILMNNLLLPEFNNVLNNLKAYSESNIDLDIDNFLLHLNQNLDYYHRLIWCKMDANRRFAILDNRIAPNTGAKSIASVVDNKIIGVVGNSIIMPLSAGLSLDPILKEHNPSQTLKDFLDLKSE